MKITVALVLVIIISLSILPYIFGQAVTPSPTPYPQRVYNLGGEVGGMIAPSDPHYLYVSDKTNDRVIKLDLCSFSFAEVTVTDQPTALVLSPDESRLYVVQHGATSL